MNVASITTLTQLSALDLLKLHSAAADELWARGVTRSANSPVGDFAENLFCRAFGWRQASASLAAADAVDDAGVRYQIKSRRLTAVTTSRQLSALRNLAGMGFDVLAAVLFDKDYTVQRAALVPHAIVVAEAKHQQHINSARFMLRDGIWELSGVRDVTPDLRRAAAAWALDEFRA